MTMIGTPLLKDLADPATGPTLREQLRDKLIGLADTVPLTSETVIARSIALAALYIGEQIEDAAIRASGHEY